MGPLKLSWHRSKQHQSDRTTSMSSSWISLTSLLLITFVFLSITTSSSKAEGKRGDVEKVGKVQALGGAHTGKEGPGKAKLKLKKRKQKRRKAASKKVKGGKKEHNNRRLKGKDSNIPSKRRKNNKQSPKDTKKKKNKKNTKKNDDD